jgi:serine/threonine-protein kinase
MVPASDASVPCLRCGHPVPVGSRFCPECGAEAGARAPAGSKPTAKTVRDPELPLAPRPAATRALPTVRATTALDAADPLIGQVIADRYRILSLLGRGGMGVVYKAEHVHIGKLVALKLLSGQLAGDPQTVRRFRREAQAVSTLRHPNTVQIFDFGQSARLAYLVMEYLPGQDFGALILEQAPLSFVRVVKICAQVAASVAEAHERGIIHRDIKPENVMIVETPGQTDFVKVLDFGIAKLRDPEEHGPATQRGHILGTPYYMSPEQIRGDPYDHRVDVYALGAMMYKALAGVPPFVADTPMGVLTQHLNEPLIPLRERAGRDDLPDDADRIIARAMQKDPRARYATMQELRADLIAYLSSVAERDTTDALALTTSQPAERSAARLGDRATRGDVDGYEKRLRRTSRLGVVLGLAAVCALGYGALRFFKTRPAVRDLSVEQEPNDEPVQANRLQPGKSVSGHVGKRQSVTQGDADVYFFEVPIGSRRVVRAELSALPNMDLVLELVRRGESKPMLVVDTKGLAEPEMIPNLTLLGGGYYLRVREHWEAGRLPTENVSDTYALALSFVGHTAHDENEPNDAFETADTLGLGQERRGYVGWTGDRDVYCVASTALPARAVLGPVPGLNLALEVVDRSSGASEAVDQAGVGEGESARLTPHSGESRLCVVVFATAQTSEKLADPRQTYTLSLTEP